MPSVQLGRLSNGGPGTQLLASEAKQLLQTPTLEVVPVCSGTAALHAIVAALQLKSGRDLVWVTQAFTFPSSVQGPMRHSLVLDMDTVHRGPNVDQLTPTQLKQMDGLVVTLCFGFPVDLAYYRAWSRTHGKWLVLDNAACPLTFLHGDNTLLYADAAAVSLHETKPLGRGEGVGG